jgi:hypothetical protein
MVYWEEVNHGDTETTEKSLKQLIILRVLCASVVKY